MSLSKSYFNIYGNYWNPVDEKIVKLIMSHIEKNQHVFEIGFASGHYMAYLDSEGFNVSGIEIRDKAFHKVQDIFKEDYSHIKLISGDVMQFKGKYDLVYSTGLIQCFATEDRISLLKHISTMSDKVVYTVPKIDEVRNVGSKENVAVAGCTEYVTGNIAYELSEIYGYVETGIWEKKDIGLPDDFQWFYCDNLRK